MFHSFTQPQPNNRVVPLWGARHALHRLWVQCGLWIAAILGGLLLGASPVQAQTQCPTLWHLMTQRQGIALDGIAGVAVSLDGNFVYTANFADDTVAVFRRNSTGDLLNFVEQQQDKLNGVSGLDGARGLVITPDGKQLYVVGYYAGAVAIFSRNAENGRLTFLSAVYHPNLEGPVGLALSPDGKQLYVVNFLEDSLVAFDRDLNSGALTPLQVLRDGLAGVDGLDSVENIAISADGKHVYTVSDRDNAVTTFRRDSATGLLSLGQSLRDDVGGVDGLNGAQGVALSPDGKQLYVAGRMDDALAIFDRDPATGALTFVQAFVNNSGGVVGLDGAIGVTASPNGQQVYVASFDNKAIVVFKRDTNSGALTFVQSIPSGFDSAQAGGVLALSFSPDGVHLFAADFAQDRLLGFTVKAADGTLTYAAAKAIVRSSPISTMDAVASIFSDDGKYLYTLLGEGYGSTLTVQARDPASGALTLLQTIEGGQGGPAGMSGVIDLLISPDGGNLYLINNSPPPDYLPTLVAFRRDPLAGLLTLVQELSEEFNVVNGLYTPRAFSLSPDGAHLYVASTDDKVIGIFNRIPISGVLSFAQTISLTTNVSTPWVSVVALKISPDGKQLYVAGDQQSDNNTMSDVAVFNRDAATGQLTPFAVTPISGLGPGEAADMAISPDGKHLYLAGARQTPGNHEAVTAIINRDNATGQLTPAQTLVHNTAKTGQMTAVRALTLSADGQDLYLAGLERVGLMGAVAQFSRDAATGLLTLITVKQNYKDGVNGLYAPLGLTVSPDGKQIYVPGEDTMVVFNKSANNAALTFGEALTTAAPEGLVGFGAPTAVTIAPDGRHLFVLGESGTAVAVFKRDPLNGAIAFVQSVRPGLRFMRAITVSPNGQHLYLLGNSRIDGQPALAVFHYDPAQIGFQPLQIFTNGTNNMSGLHAVPEMRMSGDGTHVYIANEIDQTIVLFTRNPADGLLTVAASLPLLTEPAIQEVLTYSLSPDSAYFYMGAWYYGADSVRHYALYVYRRDAATGALTFVHTLDVKNLRYLAVSTNNVYVVGANYDSFNDRTRLQVYHRNRDTGVLTFLAETPFAEPAPSGYYSQDMGGLAISANDRWIYISNYFLHGVYLLEQLPDGAVIAQTKVTDGIRVHKSFNNDDPSVRAMAVSPDSRNLYVLNESDHALLAYTVPTCTYLPGVEWSSPQ